MIEKKTTRGEAAAREMVHRLEEVMVRVGYTRDGRYAEQHTRRRTSNLIWRDGKILVGATEVDDLDAWGLLWLADRLPYLLDALENNSRHLADRLLEAVETLQALIDRIEDDPQPASQESEG